MARIKAKKLKPKLNDAAATELLAQNDPASAFIIVLCAQRAPAVFTPYE